MPLGKGTVGIPGRVYYFHTKVLVVTIETAKVRGSSNRGIGIGERERGRDGERMRTGFKFCQKSTLTNTESFVSF